MASNVPSTTESFSEILKFYREGEYLKAQKIASKVLKENPEDRDALHCKIICLINQSYFKEAIDVITSGEKKGLISLPFERAYCYYRLNNLTKACEVLGTIKEPGLKEKELLAQVHYRLEDYERCLGLYKDIIRNSHDDFEDEREANRLAVVAAAQLWKDTALSGASSRSDTFELCYNSACLLLGQGDLGGALKKLKEAEDLCRKSLEDDPDITEEEVEEELSVLRAQTAYIYQLMGNQEEASQVYAQILRKKPNDIALSAVVSNNVITINKDKDVFDSKKKLKAITTDGLSNKLTKFQLKALEVNKTLLHMYINQAEACKKSLKNLRETYNESEKAALIEAALLLREKHTDQAVEILKSLIVKENSSGEFVLALAQLYLTKGKLKEAANVLQNSGTLKHTPGMVSYLISIYSQLNETEAALEVLDNAVAYAEENKKSVPHNHLVTVLRENAAFKLRVGRSNEAVQVLEKLRREEPSDIKTLARIIMAYSQTDQKRAAEYSQSLPPLSSISDTSAVNIESLEMSHLIGSMRFSKKPHKVAEEQTEDRSDQIIKKRKKKKKKGKLPKNFNAEVDPDPERWLPRWERSTYKHKKQKKGQVGKGTQGSAIPEGPASPKPAKAVSVPSPSAAAPTSPNPSATVVPPRQQKPSQAAKAKGKKKKKGGW